ncbi:DUF6134 family protein [Flavobacterium sp. 14A]|uniref:DUF6134 family protein n=1 Tax=Flavobacterium sp. 14A TaxID=2735896 RepID=UPI0015712C6C|nr:DUF6134 family protein [Flavobacterium sp. 14A]NRT13022.1 hypothetical protein [Flavobacterium sp. 14A]
MNKFYTLLLSLFSLLTHAQNQEHIYDISVNGNTVGELTVSKLVEGEKTTYKLNSKSVISLFRKTTITTSFIGVFKNNILQTSSYISQKNSKPYDNSIITENNGVYTITRKGKKATINKPIKYVTCLLYFEKPVVNEPYFDVLEAVFSPITAVDQNKYVLIDSSNNEKTTYDYLNAVLQQGSTKHVLYDFTFTLRK